MKVEDIPDTGGGMVCVDGKGLVRMFGPHYRSRGGIMLPMPEPLVRMDELKPKDRAVLEAKIEARRDRR